MSSRLLLQFIILFITFSPLLNGEEMRDSQTPLEHFIMADHYICTNEKLFCEFKNKIFNAIDLGLNKELDRYLSFIGLRLDSKEDNRMSSGKHDCLEALVTSLFVRALEKKNWEAAKKIGKISNLALSNFAIHHGNPISKYRVDFDKENMNEHKSILFLDRLTQWVIDNKRYDIAHFLAFEWRGNSLSLNDLYLDILTAFQRKSTVDDFWKWSRLHSILGVSTSEVDTKILVSESLIKMILSDRRFFTENVEPFNTCPPKWRKCSSERAAAYNILTWGYALDYGCNGKAHSLFKPCSKFNYDIHDLNNWGFSGYIDVIGAFEEMDKRYDVGNDGELVIDAQNARPWLLSMILKKLPQKPSFVEKWIKDNDLNIELLFPFHDLDYTKICNQVEQLLDKTRGEYKEQVEGHARLPVLNLIEYNPSWLKAILRFNPGNRVVACFDSEPVTLSEYLESDESSIEERVREQMIQLLHLNP